MSSRQTIEPGAWLGMLGGGQLGRMFTQAAQAMGYFVHVYTPEENSPASQVAAKTTVASFEDTVQLEQFAKSVAVISLEFENIPKSALDTLVAFAPIRPNANVLATTQNRALEKNFVAAQRIAVTPFAPINSAADFETALNMTGAPAVLKTAGFGYDGKGQVKVDSPGALAEAFEQIGKQPAILEKRIDLKTELSVIGARTPDGQTAFFGPFENTHENHILSISKLPAYVSDRLHAGAIEATETLLHALQVEGLLTVEFFVTQDGELLVNELAPRPHNSGHLTIEACPVSQFEQQVRAICNLPLGETTARQPAGMLNIIGETEKTVAALTMADTHLHLYGKAEARPGRKMGHITVLGDTKETVAHKLKQLEGLLSKTPTGL